MRKRIKNVLTEIECILLIKEARPHLIKDFRPTQGVHRVGCQIDCQEATKLQLTLMTLAECSIKDVEPTEVVKYSPGASYPFHDDAAYKERTHTLITYLNDSYEGGRTAFRDEEVYPKTGDAVYFDINSDNIHCIKKLIHGHKWVAVTWCNRKTKTTPHRKSRLKQ